MIWSAFAILIHVYYCLQDIWSFRQANKQPHVQLDIWRVYLACCLDHQTDHKSLVVDFSVLKACKRPLTIVTMHQHLNINLLMEEVPI